ncbi:MAG: aromatic acid decarboxylase [Gammaproteobacteria bacterium]|nr:MAG: aromatic acid decarboxylase [Gammaproteobacteria bacterium]
MSKSNNFSDRVIVAISGASGAPLVINLISRLLTENIKIDLIISNSAKIVIQQETDLKLPDTTDKIYQYLLNYFKTTDKQLKLYDTNNFLSPIASGSSIADKMVICPCSSATLSAITQGLSDNLIRRGADCIIKEKKQLIIVHRESPLSTIHLKNMLKLSKIGVTILPPNPGFYLKPTKIEDILNFITDRILQNLKIKSPLSKKWMY